MTLRVGGRARLAGLIALAALGAGVAQAERIGVAVAGEGTRRTQVIDAIDDHLRARGDVADASLFPLSVTKQMATCLGRYETECAQVYAQEAAVRSVFILLAPDTANGGDALRLLGWAFDAAGTITHTDARDCAECTLGQLTSTTAALVDVLLQDRRPATLRIASTPPGAAITIDDTAVGVAPVTYSVRPGSHAVAADWHGVRVNQHVTASPNQVLQLDLTRPPRETSRDRAVVPWFLIGVGAASVAAGVTLLAIDEDVDPAPTTLQQPSYRDTARLGAALCAGGAVVAAYGTYRLVTKPRGARVIALVTPQAAGVAVHGAF